MNHHIKFSFATQFPENEKRKDFRVFDVQQGKFADMLGTKQMFISLREFHINRIALIYDTLNAM